MASTGTHAVTTVAGFAVTAALLLTSACRDNETAERPPGKDADAISASTAATAPPVPLQPLGRQALLAANIRAADATAAGTNLPEGDRSLVGRSFSISLPVGCNPATDKPADAWSSWSYEPNGRTIKLIARAENWSQSEWVRQLAQGLDFEAAEGFWIERPWTTSEQCPKTGEDADAGRGGDRPTFGLVQFFAKDSPRSFQRGARPYAFTMRARNSSVEDRSYALALDGRIGAFADGQPIHCHQPQPNQRPVCLMAVEWDRIAFVEAPDGNVLTEWQN